MAKRKEDDLVIPVPGDAPGDDGENCEGDDLMSENEDKDVVTHVLNLGFAAAANRRVDGADHYAENLRYNYLEGKDTVSFMEGTGQRIATESGSGRTRAEANAPHATGAGAPL